MDENDYDYVWCVFQAEWHGIKVLMSVHKTEKGALDYAERLKESYPGFTREIEKRILWSLTS